MFKNVAIVGVGLLGGSLARDLRAQGIAERIVGVCRSSGSADLAVSSGVVDEVLSLTEATKDADLLVLATPMLSMMPILRQLNGNVPESLIISDVGSVKMDLYDQINSDCPDLLKQFVFAHPIAGGENSGVGASKLGLFRNKHLIITQTDEVPEASVARVREMWEQVGAVVVDMGLTEHDSIFAKTSHLPHIVAFSLVNYLQAQENHKQLFEFAASGFYDFTRIASSDAEMWKDICVSNKASVLSALDGYSEQIRLIRDIIAQLDQDEILRYFSSAKIARDSGLTQKKKS